jgi:hypothetical protein
MFDWLIKNKEWVFSGIGISALAILGAAFKAFISRGNASAHASTVVVQLVNPGAQQGGAQGQELSLVDVERVAPIDPYEMQKIIESAPLLQREAVANRYVGQRIQWDTELVDAKPQGEQVRLQLRAKRANSFDPGFYAWCRVRLSDYQELAILPYAAPIRVTGTIASLSSSSVELDRARLTLPSTLGTA